MHQSAYRFGELFYQCYFKNGMRVLEIGSQNVNGSIRDFFPDNTEYIGVDFVSGKGVDEVLQDPYVLPFENEKFDIVLSSSCFEHSSFFWLSFLEILRVLKRTGIFYLNVPSNGYIHRYPLDCWRFYPDSGLALESWGEKNGYNVKLVESFISDHVKEVSTKFSSDSLGMKWSDYVAVFIKDRAFLNNYSRRIYKESDISFSNCINEFGVVDSSKRQYPYDLLLIDQLGSNIATLKDDINGLQFELLEKKFENLSLDNLLENSKVEIHDLRKILKDHEKRLDDINNSFSWKITKPLRYILGFFIK